MPESLYLMGMAKGRWAGTVRAVRDARHILHGERNINHAQQIVAELRDKGEPQLVGTNDDLELVEQAAGKLAEVDAYWEINPIIEKAEHVLHEGEDGASLITDDDLVMSVEGIRSALVTLSVANGQAPSALLIAQAYLNATRDPIWVEVRDIILTTFRPPERPHVVVAHDAGDDDEPAS